MAKKKYSIEERIKYHHGRSRGGIGRLPLDSPKRCYSDGFVEAFTGRDNEGATTREFGKRAGRAYAFGRRRGLQAAGEYFEKTKNQPFDYARDLHLYD